MLSGRELGFVGAVALAVGVMAPTLAMSVTGVAAAGQLGRAAPVAYVLAAVGVGLVASGFILLSSRYAHAGSVYAFAGHALGPRAGFLMGWALLGTYIVFPPVSLLGIGVFGQALLKSAGIADSAPWLPISLGGLGRGVGGRGAADQGDDRLAARLRGALAPADPGARRR